MRRGSNSPPFHKRRSPLRRDRREVISRRRRSTSRDRQDGNKLRRFSPSFKRSRREDDHYDRYNDRVSPYRRGHYGDRTEDREVHDRREVPDSYREFILHLPNDIKPEEAHRRYQEYLTNWHGSLAKSEFEQFKNEEWMKASNDPRTIIQIIEQHKQHGQEAAKKFAEDLKTSNEFDIHSDDFNQGVVRNGKQTEDVEGEKSSMEKEFSAPQVCWSRDRVKVDLELSTELIQKLDTEKEITFNPLLDSLSSSEPVKPEGDETEEKGEEGVEEDVDLLTKKLDLQLTYLWKVHMVDYYSGHELNDKEYESTECRMIRPPKTQEPDEETDKKMLEELSVRVNTFWMERVKNGDPLELKAQRDRIEQSIEDFVESQIIPIDDKRWGNKLSNKMFVGKEFVLKHIRLKHTSVVDNEREKIMDKIYFENFRKQKEEDERKLAEQKRTAQFDPQAMDISFNGYGDGFGTGNQAMICAPIVPAPMMGAPMRQVLMPAPGAGPLGPFVLQSVPAASGMPPMDMGPMSGAGRGFNSSSGVTPMTTSRASGGGEGSGGVSTRPWDGQKEYYDLDAPQNNRAILDYGDL